MTSNAQQELLKNAIKALLDNSPLDTVVACAVPINNNTSAAHPRTALLHARFNEDKPQIDALARFLWSQAVNYALPRRRRIAFQKRLQDNPADLSPAADLIQAVRNVFIEFRKQHPSRASEVGEVLAYCIALHHLNAAQVAAKMSLKTSSNMPVHGLDGIHAIFDNDALTIYFLESKLSKSANDGLREYAESVAGFLKDEKQYLREYELIGELGNLDTLEGDAREMMLQHFDVVGNPNIHRRERSVGVVCYSEKKHYTNTISVSDGPIDIHEKHFASNYTQELKHHQEAALKHLQAQDADPNKCIVFLVAVPDVNDLREKFYAAMGIDEVKIEPKKKQKHSQKVQKK